jgi:hypothetical protein
MRSEGLEYQVALLSHESGEYVVLDEFYPSCGVIGMFIIQYRIEPFQFSEEFRGFHWFSSGLPSALSSRALSLGPILGALSFISSCLSGSCLVWRGTSGDGPR